MDYFEPRSIGNLTLDKFLQEFGEKVNRRIREGGRPILKETENQWKLLCLVEELLFNSLYAEDTKVRLEEIVKTSFTA